MSEENTPTADPESARPPRVIPKINPGFREDAGESTRRSAVFGMKAPSHPKDLRNLKIVLVAVLTALAIYGALEWKQCREASLEHEAQSRER